MHETILCCIGRRFSVRSLDRRFLYTPMRRMGWCKKKDCNPYKKQKENCHLVFNSNYYHG